MNANSSASEWVCRCGHLGVSHANRNGVWCNSPGCHCTRFDRANSAVVQSTALDAEDDLASLVKEAQAEHAAPHRFTFWDLSDEGLIRVRRDYLRLLEDNPGRRSAQIDRWLAQIRWVRLVRWCLHMRYGAVDEHLGTKSFDRWHRFGDAPAYSLALDIDKLRWSYRDHPKMATVRGTRRHILNWDKFGDSKPHWLTTLAEDIAA